MAEYNNLSTSRGNRLGVGFFKVFIWIFGVRHACRFVWFVTFFYAVFDRTAFKTALFYLKKRFPESGRLMRRIHFYRLITLQAQMFILSYWIGTGHQLPIIEKNPDALRKLLEDPSKGLVLVASHFGCWQTTIAHLVSFGRKVNLLVQVDPNTPIDKRMSILGMKDKVKYIDISSFSGGLLECMEAVSRGEIVCIMGDRVTSSGTAKMNFLGTQAEFPLSPWLIAARCHCPVVPVFTALKGTAEAIYFHFSDPIYVQCPEDRKPDVGDLQKSMRKYVTALEAMIQIFPYQMFYFNLEQNIVWD